VTIETDDNIVLRMWLDEWAAMLHERGVTDRPGVSMFDGMRRTVEVLASNDACRRCAPGAIVLDEASRAMLRRACLVDMADAMQAWAT
jgi:hypothetical protein